MRVTVGHFEIPASDLGRAERFFCEAFGWQAVSAPWSGGDYRRLRPPAASEPGIAGGLLAAGELVDGQPLLVLHVEDATLEVCLARIRECGGVVELAPVAVGTAGRFARFRDPEGNRFGLWERRASGAEAEATQAPVIP